MELQSGSLVKSRAGVGVLDAYRRLSAFLLTENFVHDDAFAARRIVIPLDYLVGGGIDRRRDAVLVIAGKEMLVATIGRA